MRVFISYSFEDETVVFDLVKPRLKNHGIQFYTADSTPCDDRLTEALRGEIKECSLCLFVATEASLKSQWCLLELAAFWGSNKRILIYRPNNKLQRSDLHQFLQEIKFDGSFEEIIQTIKQIIAHEESRGPSEILESVKEFNHSLESVRFDSLNESQPMKGAALKYFETVKTNIVALSKSSVSLTVPATQYPEYLVELQKDERTCVKAVAVINQVEEFWGADLGEQILGGCKKGRTERIFAFQEPNKCRELRGMLQNHSDQYEIGLIANREDTGLRGLQDFSLIWDVNAEIVDPSDPPAGTIVARYKMRNGTNEIEFSSDSATVQNHWREYIRIKKHATQLSDFGDSPNWAEVENAIFEPAESEMSNYIAVESYERYERLHPYFTEMRDSMLEYLRDIDLSKQPKVWEVGAGTGILSGEILQFLESNETGRLLAVENDPEYFRFLSSKYGSHPRFSSARKNARIFDPDGKFDLIFSSFADHHIVQDDKQAETYYLNIKRNLHPSSLFVVGDEFLPEHDSSIKAERIEAIKKYHLHIIQIAEIAKSKSPDPSGYDEFIKLETEAMESGIRAVENPRDPTAGDHKVSLGRFKSRIEKAGLAVNSEMLIGPNDKALAQANGGIYVLAIGLHD